MNSSKYINVLESAVLPSFSTLFGDTNMNEVQFQQDNAPSHKFARTVTWIRENCIELLDWPAQSPTVSAIEHFWGLLESRVRYHIINDKVNLKCCLRLEWNAITVEECRNLFDSMPKKNSAVIKSKDGPTKY